MKTMNIHITKSELTSVLCTLLSVLFISCEQVEDFSQETDANTVKVVASISNLQTRVAYEDDGATNFINGDEICVQNILRENKNIATYTFDGSTWITTDALVWNGGTAESQFQAWYPATASFDEFTLPTDQNSREELPAADWMTASTSAMVKPADKTINLAFEHKLAKITVQITEFTSQFGDDPRLMAATIYSLSDEYVTVNGGIKPVLGGNAATAIVCPGRYAVDTNLMEVTISDDGRQTFLNVPVNAFLTNTGLEAGKHYKFSLKVGKDAISITKVNVEPWTTKEIDGGMAEEVVNPNIDATAMNTDELNAAVTRALAAGETDIRINLAEDADATMFSAITAALATTVDPSLDQYELVMNYSGTIDLTISGAKTVPECTFYVDEYVNENWRAGAALRSVTLTDATTIGESAFFSSAMTSFSAPNVIEIEGFALEGCMKLTDVYLPSVQTLGDAVFSDCYALKTISLPECIDLGNGVFNSCEALETVYAPKATNLGAIEFMMCTSLMKVTLGSVVSVNQLYESIDNGLFCLANDTQNIELVLSSDQKVMTFDSGTKYWTATETDYNGSDYHNNKSFIGYTFKSITFVGE